MIKALQRKFIVTAMTAVSVLLLLLLGTINVFNFILIHNQSETALHLIAESRGVHDNLPRRWERPHLDSAFSSPSEEDLFITNAFFVVHLNQDGTIGAIDLSHVSAVSEEDAIDLSVQVVKKGTGSGTLGRFLYLIREFPNAGDRVIFFLDTAHQFYISVQVFAVSIALGVLSWIFMLYLVVISSKKAVQPIQENMERQKQFITNAGHEIKTPLSIILANTEVLELHHGSSKWSRNIREQTNRLNGLMKNMLTLARMDEYKNDVVFSDLSVSTLLEEMVFAFQEPMEMRSISLKTEIQPEVHINANREMLTQMISILLDNAVKYTGEGGVTVITLQGNDGHMKLQIKNTCENLPQTPPDKLFDRFYRGSESRTQKEGGYGIGLSVAKAIAEAHRGSIWAEYQQPNWVCFHVKL